MIITNKKSGFLPDFICVPSMLISYRVEVPNTEGDKGVSQRQGCLP
jgi:hypothetical protein